MAKGLMLSDMTTPAIAVIRAGCMNFTLRLFALQ